MADRYDESSVENVDKYENTDAASSDNWADLVTHITGYPVPKRSEIFDTLRSDHGGKLFRMDIKERSLGLLLKDSGFMLDPKNQDYDIWFFDSGKKRSVMQARIVFEGRVKSGDETVFAGTDSTDVNNVSVREGNEFTDYNKDKFSTIPLARYMNGPRAALMALLKGNSGDGRFSGLVAKESDVVDLSSFTKAGYSFDYAAKFFKDHAPLLKDWEDRFGRDDASWKGEAAEVFRSLIKKIRENYDSYVETFNETAGSGDATGTGSTVYSRALSLGRSHLEQAARDLLNNWLTWAQSDYYDPHRVLRYVLDDLAKWVDAENVARTEIKSYTTRYSTTVSHNPKEGFTQVHPDYGDLTDIANWAKVGDKAVDIWSRAVDDLLVKPAREVQSRLNNQFLTLSKDFSENVPEPKSTGTASEEYEKKKLEEEKEKINEENEENRRYQDELREEQRKQREEDKKYQDELREEQNKQREEDKKLQDELREEQRLQREEDKKLQDELREEQNKQREEDKKYQDELREEQRREQEEAKREAEEQAKQMEESLGNINGPGGGGGEGLGDLDDLLNLKQDIPVTESTGNLDGINSPGPGGSNTPSLDDVTNAVSENLGNLGDVNNPGDVNTAGGGPLPVGQNLGNFGQLNGGPGTRNPNDAANQAITENLGSLGDLNNGSGGSLDTPTGGRTQLDGNQLTTGFPDGSSTSFDPDSGLLTTTHPDGSVTTQDLGDGTRVTNPDGSVTSLGDDGKLTTTFPDGTKQEIDPATGQVTSTAPDGSVTTENLGSLEGLNNRNGIGDLGDLGNINADLPTESPGDLGDLGDRETVNDLGDLGNLNADDAGLESPTGSLTGLENGDFATTFPDGGKAVFDPDTGQLTSIAPDGSKVTTDLTHGAEVTNPDGSVSSLDNGRFLNSFPDGSSHSIDPDTGIATVTDPQGRTETVALDELNSAGGNSGGNDSRPDFLDDLRDLGQNRDLGNLGDLNGNQDLDGLNGNRDLDLDGLKDLANGSSGSGGGGGGDGTSTRDVSLSELGLSAQAGAGGSGGGLSGANLPSAETLGQVAPLSDSAANNATTPGAGSGGGPGAPGAPGTPGTPGMPMGGGMGGMGAGGGEKGNGERVRAVLVDAAEESERRNRRRRSPWNRQEDSDTFLAPAQRVSTTGGNSPEEEGEQERRPATAADYLEEDVDVWGTEEGGTPAVIGR
ncbi:AAWKG family protein [Streptomyces sp. ATCC51928]|uniref:AAWKG family protein n=1 Tax=Streptomyces caviscabies TaxID=90079 RepID=A0ABW2MHI5_9ACTN|nr:MULTISPECIES: AAWKG family protein [unclassified Streptomyces]MDX3504703.1 AAWKG family protein [Streptomyces sp. ATCC51928]MDX5524377.1 AAWKG family protein [Streptomyces sp. DE06-01C]